MEERVVATSRTMVARWVALAWFFWGLVCASPSPSTASAIQINPTTQLSSPRSLWEPEDVSAVWASSSSSSFSSSSSSSSSSSPTASSSSPSSAPPSGSPRSLRLLGGRHTSSSSAEVAAWWAREAGEPLEAPRWTGEQGLAHWCPFGGLNNARGDLLDVMLYARRSNTRVVLQDFVDAVQWGRDLHRLRRDPFASLFDESLFRRHVPTASPAEFRGECMPPASTFEFYTDNAQAIRCSINDLVPRPPVLSKPLQSHFCGRPIPTGPAKRCLLVMDDRWGPRACGLEEVRGSFLALVRPTAPLAREALAFLLRVALDPVRLASLLVVVGDEAGSRRHQGIAPLAPVAPAPIAPNTSHVLVKHWDECVVVRDSYASRVRAFADPTRLAGVRGPLFHPDERDLLEARLRSLPPSLRSVPEVEELVGYSEAVLALSNSSSPPVDLGLLVLREHTHAWKLELASATSRAKASYVSPSETEQEAIFGPRLPRAPPSLLGRGVLALQVRRGDFKEYCDASKRRTMGSLDCAPSDRAIVHRVSTELASRPHFHTVVLLTERDADFAALQPLLELGINTARSRAGVRTAGVRVVRYTPSRGSGFLRSDGAARDDGSGVGVGAEETQASNATRVDRRTGATLQMDFATREGKRIGGVTWNQLLLIEMAIAEQAEAFIGHPGSSIGFYVKEARWHLGQLESALIW